MDIFTWTYNSIKRLRREMGWFLWSYPKITLFLLQIYPIYVYIPAHLLPKKRLEGGLMSLVLFAFLVDFFRKRRLPYDIREALLLLFLCGLVVGSFLQAQVPCFHVFLSVIWALLSLLIPPRNFWSVSSLLFSGNAC